MAPRFWFLNLFSHHRETVLLGEVADFQGWGRKTKMSLETSFHALILGSARKMIGICQKDPGTSLKEFPQIWDNSSNKVTNNNNEIQLIK